MARHLQFRLAYPPRDSQPCPGCVSRPVSFAEGPRFSSLAGPSDSPVVFIGAAIAISLGIVFAIRTASKA